MLEKKVVIRAIPALQGNLYNRLKYLPFVEPITARNLIAKDFRDNAARDELERFKKDAKQELGSYYYGLSTAKRDAGKEPSKILEEWKATLLSEEKIWEAKMAICRPAIMEDGADPKEMLAKVRRLILRADECLLGDSWAGRWEDKLGIALARLHSEGNLHVYVSVLDGNGTRYGNALVSTNLGSTHNIPNKKIEELLAEPIETAGHGVSFKFSIPHGISVPIFQLQAHPHIAMASLEGIAKLVETISFQ
ncbi:Uncharacterised protein [uncultured archaeon]|nr:Uncharacterised protein [uncultured archaeon]